MGEPINTWDHVIPEGRGEFDGASWSKLSVVFGADYHRYLMAAYGLIVLDEGGGLTGHPRERLGERLWVLAHSVEEMGDMLFTVPTSKFSEEHREKFRDFREFIRFCMGRAHPLGLLELLHDRGTYSHGLTSPAARRGELRMLREVMTWYVLIPEWERWFAVVQSDCTGEPFFIGGSAA